MQHWIAHRCCCFISFVDAWCPIFNTDGHAGLRILFDLALEHCSLLFVFKSFWLIRSLVDRTLVGPYAVPYSSYVSSVYPMRSLAVPTLVAFTPCGPLQFQTLRKKLGSGRGVGQTRNPFHPKLHPLLFSPFFPHSSPPLRYRRYFLHTRGALVCWLAFSISPLGKMEKKRLLRRLSLMHVDLVHSVFCLITFDTRLNVHKE